MVRTVVLVIVLAGVVASVRGEASSRPGSPEAVCPVDWRGVPFGEALGELAGRLGVSYILDESVDAKALERRVRMSASHLTGEQAFRWLARSAGLAAVLVDETFLISAEGRLPAVWRATGTAGKPGGSSGDDARWRRVRLRQGDVKWVDAPLSGVARDVGEVFGVDLVFHRAVLADQGLVHFEGPGVSLERVCRELASQLGARVRFLDGAAWVCPAEAGSQAPSAAGPAGEGAGGKAREWAAGPLDRLVRIDRSVTSWRLFAARVAEAGGFSYRIEVPPGVSYATIEASGPVAAVLEAAQLLGRLVWTVEPAASPRAPTLVIRVRETG